MRHEAYCAALAIGFDESTPENRAITRKWRKANKTYNLAKTPKVNRITKIRETGGPGRNGREK